MDERWKPWILKLKYTASCKFYQIVPWSNWIGEFQIYGKPWILQSEWIRYGCHTNRSTLWKREFFQEYNRTWWWPAEVCQASPLTPKKCARKEYRLSQESRWKILWPSQLAKKLWKTIPKTDQFVHQKDPKLETTSEHPKWKNGRSVECKREPVRLLAAIFCRSYTVVVVADQPYLQYREIHHSNLRLERLDV